MTIAIIPARAGSKGLPGKNMRPLLGIPLYQVAVSQALRTVGKCLISTDIPQILSKEPEKNCLIARRPEDLAGDQASMSDVLLDLIPQLGLRNETIVLLQPTSPARSDEDIYKAIKKFHDGGFDLVMGVKKTDASTLKSGIITNDVFSPLSDPRFCFTNRQQLPPVFLPNGAIYVFSAKTFMRKRGFPTDRIGALEMPADRSLDVDTLDDFHELERIMATRHKRR